MASTDCPSPSLKRPLSIEPLSPLWCTSKKRDFAIPTHRSSSRLILRPFTGYLSPPSTRRPYPDPERPQRRQRARFPSIMSSHPIRRPSDASIPSFMSVYDTKSYDQAQSGAVGTNLANISTRFKEVSGTVEDPGTQSPLDSYPPSHKTAGSASTENSDTSSESSPTTTVSTFDSASMTDPSPLVSPDSPALQLPASPHGLRLRRAATENVMQLQSEERTSSDSARPGMAARKARNLKNLAVNTSQGYSLGKAISTAQLPMSNPPDAGATQERISAPASPSFIKPMTPPKRKPTNLGLTIMTPSKSNFPPSLAIPQTPTLRRPSLRHFQSSPSLPLVTPSLPPTGGMRLPPTLPRPQPHGFAEVPMEDDEEPEPNFDIPQSREEKPEAYPDGPIRIYESGIDLFLEPSAEIAARYDVVFNVASEVKNPFQSSSDAAQLGTNSTGTANLVGVLDAAATDSSSSPTTPKAKPVGADMEVSSSTLEQAAKQPEYIHIPWEHNTDIVPDLHKLVRVIDDRVRKGKSVLVHCQCGVSRSASLIVAYGLYKDHDLTVQEAYDAVKRRSKWIGPNMNLIMQLQEFKAGLKFNAQPQSGYGIQKGVPLSSTNLASMSSPDAPHTAPLQADGSPQRASTGNITMSATTRSSTHIDLFDPTYRRSWAAGHPHFDGSSSHTITPYVDPSGHVVSIAGDKSPESRPPVPPLPQLKHLDQSSNNGTVHAHAADVSKKLASRKSVPNFSRQLPLRFDQEDVPMIESDAPVEGALISPRETQFAMTSIHQPKAEDSFDMFSPLATHFQHEALQPINRTTLDQPTTAFDLSAAMAPASDGFIMSPANERSVDCDTSFGLFSPTAGSFPRDMPAPMAQSTPRQFAANAPPTVSDSIASPRSEMFGMTGFSRQEPADTFGILSPMQQSFTQSPWDILHQSSSEVIPSIERDHSVTPQAHSFERRPSTPPALTDTSSPDYDMSPSPPATHHLEGVPRSNLRTKFSSPNLAEQRRLQQLQTEIESNLPHHAPEVDSVDDALMSPRATEFTKNPFHFEVPSVGEHNTTQQTVTQVASDNREAAVAAPVAVDPRSPAQIGINPITRNIFDVL